MRVLKFGGTSLANAEKFMQCRQIILQAQQAGPVAVVLSAPTTVTNTLVELVQSAQQGQVDQQKLDDLQQCFTQIIQGLLTPPLQQQLLHQLQQQLAHLQQLLSSIVIFAFCPDKIEAEIICLGERLSILLMQNYWQQQQDQVVVIEPQRYLLAKGSYLAANVDIEQSIARFKSHPLPAQSTILLLMAGFMAGNEQGELVVLGRNGSDYSAAVLAACLQAECCEIWTDVDGIYTCDPRIVDDAKLLKQLSYQEAMELSYFGAKVLHPRTIAPIAQFQIPCLIKNSRHPDRSGTCIHRQSDASQSQIKGITHLENNVMLNLSGPGMKGMVGMAGRLFAAMSQANISIILISQSSSEYSICFCIAQQQWSQAQHVLENEFRLELQAGLLEPIESIQPVAIISVVGDGMRTQSGVAAKLLGALAHGKINIIAMAQGSSERSISVVVDNQAAKRGIRLIHQRLFSVDRVIEVIVVGCGGVGKALLAQIARQQGRLKQKNIDLRVCGISNSRHALYDVNGIDLAHWSSRLAQQTSGFSLQQLQQVATSDWLINPVIVDCTSSQEIADHYASFFQWGFHVVTPNKKANTGSWQYYQQIQQSARQARRQFLYETTVGAGLPVIENLQNLLNAGDELIQFSGILSGSLSYIFGLLDEGVSFSQATWQAKQQGYTEPDPRDDLSGMDVARKLLILAREVGLSLELADIEIEAILPAHAVVDGDNEQFMRSLADVDHYFAEQVMQAQQQNKVLRYVGQIKEGKASVNLLAVDSQHPLYKVKNGENALAFYSQYYQPLPLVLRGYGAGNDVTAAGIFADILRTAHWQWRQ